MPSKIRLDRSRIFVCRFFPNRQLFRPSKQVGKSQKLLVSSSSSTAGVFKQKNVFTVSEENKKPVIVEEQLEESSEQSSILDVTSGEGSWSASDALDTSESFR